MIFHIIFPMNERRVCIHYSYVSLLRLILSGDHREICRRRALHRFGHCGALGRRILRLLLLLREALMPGHFGLGAQLAVLVLEKGRHVAAKKDGLDVDFYIWNQSITVLSLCYQLELT